VIVRMQADAVPQQSRAATGVRLQRLDAGDRLTEVVLVPPAAPESDSEGGSDGEVEPALAPEPDRAEVTTAETETEDED
jgi:DNA gyrase subunit A